MWVAGGPDQGYTFDTIPPDLILFKKSFWPRAAIEK